LPANGVTARVKRFESLVHRPLVVLLDLDDWACAQAVCDDLSEMTLLVYDLDLHLTLMAHKIEHITAWDLLSAEDREAVRARAAQAWDFWQQSAQFRYGGLDLFKLAEVRHRGWVNRCSFATFVLQRALEYLRPGEVVTFEEPFGHGLTPPLDYHKMPILFMLVRGMAERRGIPVRLIAIDNQVRRPRHHDPIAAHKAATCHESVDLGAVLPADPYILFFGNGVDLSRQQDLIHELQRAAHLPAVQLYRNAGAELLATLQANGHSLYHDEQVAPFTSVTLDAAAVGAARQAFDAARAKAADELGDIFANPAGEPHYSFLFGSYLESLAGHVNRWNVFFEHHRPELLVVHSPEPVVEIAAAHNIPSLLLPHSLMLTGVIDYVSSAERVTLGALSSGHADRLIASGIPRERVRVTGDPRVDQITAQQRDSVQQSRQRIRERFGILSDEHAVLIITGSLALPAQQINLPRMNWKGAADGYVRLIQELATVTKCRTLVKPHPRYDHPLLVDYANRSLSESARVERVTDEALTGLVAASDAVVVFNIITSALIEASFMPRPVMVFSESMCWYDPSEWEMQHWAHFDSVQQLSNYLQTIFADSEAYTAAVAQTTAARQAYLGQEDRPALPRCVGAIQDLMQSVPMSISHR
jgi:hypothetical protein